MTRTINPIRSRRRAFTLIEVLMAAFVIGLGVLGLAAIFAGAAFQQQISSEITASITLSRSAESSIATQIGTLRPECNVSNPDAQFRPGVWYPLTTSSSSSANPEVGMLTADPAGNFDWFFATSPTEPMPRVLYSQNRPYAGLVEGVQLTTADLNNRALIRDFGKGRIIAESLVIEVTLGRFVCDPETDSLRSNLLRRDVLRFTHVPGSNPCPPATQTARYEDGNSFIEVDLKRIQQGNDINASIVNMYIAELDEEGTPWLFNTGGGFDPCGELSADVYEIIPGNPADAEDFMIPDANGIYSLIPDPRNDTTIYSVNPTTGDVVLIPGGRTGTPVFALIEGSSPGGYSLSDDPAGEPVRPARAGNRFIDRIEIVDYRWRSTDIATLSQRIRYERDASRADGQRPAMSYSIMFRRLPGSDSTQVILFTYAITGGSGNAQFVPAERPNEINNRLAPLRRERLRLAYDDEERAYFVTSTGESSDWMIRSGQLLLFQGSQTVPGADAPVRIIRVRTVGNQSRGYLESAPRTAGKSLLVEQGGASGLFDVWSIQPTIRSVTDSSSWSLRPIEARVLQITAN